MCGTRSRTRTRCDWCHCRKAKVKVKSQNTHQFFTSKRHGELNMIRIPVYIVTLLCAVCIHASDFPVVPKETAPPKLEGDLSDSAWKSALVLKLEKQPDFKKSKPAPVEPCEVRI